MRLVAFQKAMRAGAVGALAWELLLRLLMAAGVPLFDLLHTLGTILLPQAGVWEWWLAGAAMHVLAGVVWAVFYAYFFFYTFDWPPALQGLAFAAVPFTLAGLVMVPQIGLMHGGPPPGAFAIHYGWGGPASLALGHAVYGLAMGALYTRPVGRPVRRVAVHG